MINIKSSTQIFQGLNPLFTGIILGNTLYLPTNISKDFE